jgi:hypothetical protein
VGYLGLVLFDFLERPKLEFRKIFDIVVHQSSILFSC